MLDEDEFLSEHGIRSYVTAEGSYFWKRPVADTSLIASQLV